jgi:flagellar hook protein FlgE
MGLMGIAGSGMRAAMVRMDAAASNIAAGSIASAAPVRPVIAVQREASGGGVSSRLSYGTPSGADLTTDGLIDAHEAGLAYKADAAAVKAFDEMIGTLLDMQA